MSPLTLLPHPPVVEKAKAAGEEEEGDPQQATVAEGGTIFEPKVGTDASKKKTCTDQGEFDEHTGYNCPRSPGMEATESQSPRSEDLYSPPCGSQGDEPQANQQQGEGKLHSNKQDVKPRTDSHASFGTDRNYDGNSMEIAGQPRFARANAETHGRSPGMPGDDGMMKMNDSFSVAVLLKSKEDHKSKSPPDAHVREPPSHESSTVHEEDVVICEEDEESNDLDTCIVCGENLKYLSPDSRQRHLNDCMDGQQQPHFSASPAHLSPFMCSICGKDMSSWEEEWRIEHCNRCIDSKASTSSHVDDDDDDDVARPSYKRNKMFHQNVRLNKAMQNSSGENGALSAACQTSNSGPSCFPKDASFSQSQTRTSKEDQHLTDKSHTANFQGTKQQEAGQTGVNSSNNQSDIRPGSQASSCDQARQLSSEMMRVLRKSGIDQHAFLFVRSEVEYEVRGVVVTVFLFVRSEVEYEVRGVFTTVFLFEAKFYSFMQQ